MPNSTLINESSTESAKLIIFSSAYPFSKGETFLENELIILSQFFTKVVIFPLYNPLINLKARKVPENVEFDKILLSSNQPIRLLKGIFNLAPILPHLWDLWNLFKSGEQLNYNIKHWFLSLITFRTFYSSERFSLLKNHLNENDIVYFYWGLGQTSVLPYLLHKKTFVRFHGGEIDFDRHKGYIPLIQRIVSSAPNILAISDLVKNSLVENFNYDPTNIKISRLGVFDLGESPLPKKFDRIRLVSCSNFYPLKRIHLIVEALSLIRDIEVDWIHFGSGPLFKKIEMLADANLSSNINYKFWGKVANEKILTFYKENYVDLFVNVSNSEGVPVSIMEAMSFGIPCFATNVGATGELLNNDIGYLVNVEFDTETLVKVIRDIRNEFTSHRRKEIKKSWQRNYNADMNFKSLASFFNHFN